MKKILLSAFVVLSFAGYAFHKYSEGVSHSDAVNLGSKNTLTLTNPSTPSSTATTSPTTSSMGMGNGSGMQGGMMNSSKYKDGTYTSAVADAFYGNVQIQLTVSSGKITDVNFLQYPNDRRTSQYISQQAMPYLKQEAIAAQSDQVNTISGATQTSRGFREAMQSALAQAM